MFLKYSHKAIEKAYENVKEKVGNYMHSIDPYILSLPEKEAVAMKYLYATMPFSDIGNYPPELYYEFAEHGVWLYETNKELRLLPESVFLQYVLYHRVNEEEIRPCRRMFYEKMKGQISGKSLKERALEVNYWCAGEVSYESSDDRTLSAAAVYQRGYGRCGEESVFTVNSLRSAGIPARQVYAPYWSHCDDNHAWVEVFTGDGWHFMGACEPEPILDMGWFEYAASRAMMVHARSFDDGISAKQPGDQHQRFLEEEVIAKDGMTLMQNELRRYADHIHTIEVLVLDENENPVPDSMVLFEVLNYAAFRPVASCRTNKEGKAFLSTGAGDLHIFVSFHDRYAQGFLNVKKEQRQVLILKELFFSNVENSEAIWEDFDMDAPKDRSPVSERPTPEQKKAGKERMETLRERQKTKRKTWRNPEVERYQSFLETRTKKEKEAGEELLQIVTSKDRTDISYEVLMDHLTGALQYSEQFSRKNFTEYILNPRAGDEVLTGYRTWFQKVISSSEQERYRKEPKRIWKMIENRIREFPDYERGTVITTPKGCFETKTGSRTSKRVLFVAMARSFGIPARLCPEDGTAEYWENGRFIPVENKSGKDTVLLLKADDPKEWKYARNWSVTRMTRENALPLCFTDDGWNDGTKELLLEAGLYRLITVLRLPNGAVRAKQCTLFLDKGCRREVRLEMRDAGLTESFQSLLLPEFTVKDQKGRKVSSSVLTKGEACILIWAGTGEEPTEHIFNEIIEQKEEFKRVSSRIIIFIHSHREWNYPLLKIIRDTFPDIQMYYDDFKEHVPSVGRRLYVDHEKLPILAVTNGEHNVKYSFSGYQVGAGNLLLRILDELKKEKI